MSKYDGWVIKESDGYLSRKSFHRRRIDVIKWWNGLPFPLDCWKNFSRRNDHKIVKIKLVEVE